ncbi:MAG: hypothetical protein ABWW69_01135 [Pyrodictiaceae archaeon]
MLQTKILAGDPNIVFRSTRRLLDLGAHVEIVFLIVTRANDSEDCIDWVIGRHPDTLGPHAPLHINRYYPANKYYELPTSIGKLIYAYRRAWSEGVEYVYTRQYVLRGIRVH